MVVDGLQDQRSGRALVVAVEGDLVVDDRLDRLVLAVVRRLLLVLEATGDLPRTTDALDRFLRDLPAE